MTQYFSKKVYLADIDTLDTWLNGLAIPGYGTTIVGYTGIPPQEIAVTVKRWKLAPVPGMTPQQFQDLRRPQPTVIDEEYDTPSIQVGMDDCGCGHDMGTHEDCEGKCLADGGCGCGKFIPLKV